MCARSQEAFSAFLVKKYTSTYWVFVFVFMCVFCVYGTVPGEILLRRYKSHAKILTPLRRCHKLSSTVIVHFLPVLCSYLIRSCVTTLSPASPLSPPPGTPSFQLPPPPPSLYLTNHPTPHLKRQPRTSLRQAILVNPRHFVKECFASTLFDEVA